MGRLSPESSRTIKQHSMPVETYRGEVVDGSGEALGLASHLVHEGNVLGDSEELSSALNALEGHLGGSGCGAARYGGSALEAEASHTRRGEGRGGGRTTGQHKSKTRHCYRQPWRLLQTDFQKDPKTRKVYGFVFFKID